MPAAATIGWLVNPRNPNTPAIIRDIEGAGRKLGRRVVIANLSSEADLDAAFAILRQELAGALAMGADPIFPSLSDQLIERAARHAIPTMYPFREFVVAGGLVSYGSNLADVYHQIATYTARILKGEKPADLPVVQSTKYELVINLKTAKMLDLEVPLSLLMRIDEVIE